MDDDSKGARSVTTTLPELWTSKEVAAALRLTPTRVQQLARDGQIAAFRIGERGDYRFQPKDVKRFLDGVNSS